MALILAAMLAGPGIAPASASVTATTCSGARASIPNEVVRAGQWVVVENNVGDRPPRYGTATNFSGVPFCAVRITDSGAASAPQWVYCTNASLLACGQDAMGSVAGGPELGRLHEAEVAWVIARARNDTPLSRAITQTHVWCVTDRVQRDRTDGEILAAARRYFADREGITLPSGLTCPDWRRIDPTLRPDPSLRVVEDQREVVVGAQASFTVTTNLPSQRAVASDAGGNELALVVCDGQDRASLDDGVLAVSGTSNATSQTIRLCTSLDRATNATLTVTAGDVLADRLTSIRSTREPSACQLFVGATGRRLTSSAQIVAVAAPRPASPPPSASAGPPVVGPVDLAVVKERRRRRGERRRVRSGSVVDWTITVTNRGTVAAANVRVCDVIPRGLVVRRAGRGAVRSGGRVCWRVRQLPPGGRVVLRLRTLVVLDPTVRRCRRITNTATVTAPGAPRESTGTSITACRRGRPGPPGGTTG